MSIEEEIKEAVEDAVEEATEELQEALEEALEDESKAPDYLVPEHSHPALESRLEVVEAFCGSHEQRLNNLEVHEMAEEIEEATEPVVEVEPEPELDETIVDAEPEPEPETEPIEEDTKPRSWFERFFGVKK